MSKFGNWIGGASSVAILATSVHLYMTHDPETGSTHDWDQTSLQEPIESNSLETQDTETSYAEIYAKQRAEISSYFTREFGTASLHIRPPVPHPSVMESYAFTEGSVSLNPYLVKALEDSPLAREYLRSIRESCEEYDLDWRICANQLFRESRHFNEDVINGNTLSDRGAVGMAQFMPDRAREYGYGLQDIILPPIAISLYAQHMNDLRTEYDGDMTLALIAYNGGPGAVNWVREKLEDPNASGEDAMNFLQARYDELGNTGTHAYHVETRKYVIDILGMGTEENPQWVHNQNTKLNNPVFIAGLINEAHVLSVAYPTSTQESQRQPFDMAMNSFTP